MDDIITAARSALQPFIHATSLSDLYHAYKTIPFNYALAGHCLFAASLAPDFKDRFLVHFWMTFIAGFGGGVTSAILIMDPVKAPVNILANNTVGVTWVICWWLMTYSPFNIVGRLHSLLPCRMLTKACVAFLRSNLIIRRVDLAVTMYPGVIAAPLILGTLAGSGGKLISDGMRAGWGQLARPAEASAPGFVWRSAALAAAGYWGLCKATSVLSSQEAAALVITVLIAHALLSELLGAAVTDFTHPIARILHAVSLIPMPAAGPAPAPATKATRKAAEAGAGTKQHHQQQQQAKQQQQAAAAKQLASPAAAAAAPASQGSCLTGAAAAPPPPAAPLLQNGHAAAAAAPEPAAAKAKQANAVPVKTNAGAKAAPGGNGSNGNGNGNGNGSGGKKAEGGKGSGGKRVGKGAGGVSSDGWTTVEGKKGR